MIDQLMNQIKKMEVLILPDEYLNAFGKILSDEKMTDDFKALMLDIPSVVNTSDNCASLYRLLFNSSKNELGLKFSSVLLFI